MVFFNNLNYLDPQVAYYKLDYNNRVIFHLIKETISLYKIILHTCYLNKNNFFSYNLAFLFPFFFFLLFLRWIFLYFQVLPILMSPSLGYVEKKFCIMEMLALIKKNGQEILIVFIFIKVKKVASELCW